MYCEVESDEDFKLKWYKDGKEISAKTRPPWQFHFPDNSGTTVVQWPYVKNLSRGTYKCEATAGKKTLSHTVRYTPIKSMSILMQDCSEYSIQIKWKHPF